MWKENIWTPIKKSAEHFTFIEKCGQIVLFLLKIYKSARYCCHIGAKTILPHLEAQECFCSSTELSKHTAALLTATSPQVEALGEVLPWKPFIFYFNLQANTNAESH